MSRGGALTLSAAARQRGRAWLVAVIRPMPDPLRSWEQLQELTHQDLPARSDRDLRAELERLRLCGAFIEDDEHAEWLRERWAAVGRELARRAGVRRGR